MPLKPSRILPVHGEETGLEKTTVTTNPSPVTASVGRASLVSAACLGRFGLGPPLSWGSAIMKIIRVIAIPSLPAQPA
jgi:hypothetical protein